MSLQWIYIDKTAIKGECHVPLKHGSMRLAKIVTLQTVADPLIGQSTLSMSHFRSKICDFVSWSKTYWS